MAEENWHVARLIPTSGINGADEQERRATSALLAVVSSVRQFGRALIQPLGAHAGAITTFIEVPFILGDKRVYPDGLIRVQRGSKSWTALVEVKTGNNDLAAEQIENYLDVAREQGFDAVITISNEIAAMAGQHPTKVDKRKTKKVALHHLSWSHVLSEAVVQKEHRGVADPDQAWILGELIRYLEHPRSGALEFDDMGPAWVPVREAVAAGTLRQADKTAPEVAARFDALLRFCSLQLGRRLGDEVTMSISSKELADPALRTAAVVSKLVSDGVLQGVIRIPNTVGLLVVTADLPANRITCHVDIDSPRVGRPTTRVNWLIRQLRAAPETVRVEAFVMRARGASTAELLKDIREDPSVLVADSTKEIRTFRIAVSTPMGAKRGTGRGSFIDSVADAVNSFYSDVMQNLKAWTATPPKMRDVPRVPEEQRALVSTALSSQDGADTSNPAKAPASVRRPETAAITADHSPEPDAPVVDVANDMAEDEVVDELTLATSR
jgi:hypothetical protein